ncbi:MAG: tRNA guanosine(34) transglycosylase Tgt [Flavobacteriaceae bacterium]|tara:strand:+ start:107 stop:1240 length:1134 start_codon:yes stop_codon:yes gene_type:complete
MDPIFEIISFDKKSNARAGLIKTSHGKIDTPVFMPVGTQATVKGIHQRELENDINAEIILGNTYHLYLRPGIEILQNAGGIHKFMNWDKNILTDSGGYQVYSLSSTRKINENGVEFKSHIDGSKHLFTPEYAIEIQNSIGANIIMAFDECPPYPCDYSYAKNSMQLTHRWLDRCLSKFNSLEGKYGFKQIFFPIVQGSTFKDLRKESAKVISSKECFGNAIGGLSVGEPHDEMYDMVGNVCEILPKSKPRYLMGVGTPANLLENISLGVDMFDCVLPTRNGRNGMLFTSEGIINIKNKKWTNDFSSIDPENITWVDNYSKAYLKHLFSVNEMLGKQIASIHNLGFYRCLMKKARDKIIDGDFLNWKNKMVVKLSNRL